MVRDKRRSWPPVRATRAAAHFREEFPHFSIGGIGKKILLRASPVAKQQTRSPLVNNMSREQV
jgi:hypothetical protein